MKKRLLIVAAIAFSLSACGPSSEEINAKERLLAIQDSIAQAQEEAHQSELKQQLIDLKTQFEVERVKLQDIEKFQLLRTGEEKAQQVAEQTKVVEEIKNQINDLEKQIK